MYNMYVINPDGTVDVAKIGLEMVQLVKAVQRRSANAQQVRYYGGERFGVCPECHTLQLISNKGRWSVHPQDGARCKNSRKPTLNLLRRTRG